MYPTSHSNPRPIKKCDLSSTSNRDNAKVAIDQAEHHQTHAVTDVDADPDLPHGGFAGDARRNLLHGRLQLLFCGAELVG